MYHVSAQGVDERMINVHYDYYYSYQPNALPLGQTGSRSCVGVVLTSYTSNDSVTDIHNLSIVKNTVDQVSGPVQGVKKKAVL